MKSSISETTVVQFLYDDRGCFLFLSTSHPPYKVEDLIGKPAWIALTPSDAERYQAAIFRLVNGGPSESFDVDTKDIGRWRVHLHGCRIGKVRVVGIARKIPGEILELTDRQIEVCRLLADGMGSKQVAASLGCTRATADNHRANIAKKLGIDSRKLSSWCGANAEWFYQRANHRREV